MLLAMACASPEQKVSSSSAGLRKVMITSQADVEKLRGLGLDIIVEEKNYVVVRQDSTRIRALEEASIASTPAQETDLVQRMVKVHFSSREQLQQIIDLGMDVWEVSGDSLLARAYDYHLARLQADTVRYRVVEQHAGKKEAGK
jgi:hypothetical protein